MVATAVLCVCNRETILAKEKKPTPPIHASNAKEEPTCIEQMYLLSLRNGLLEFKTFKKVMILLKDSMEYTSN